MNHREILKVVSSNIRVQPIIERHPIAPNVDAEPIIAKDGITQNRVARSGSRINNHANRVESNRIPIPFRKPADDIVAASCHDQDPSYIISEVKRLTDIGANPVAGDGVVADKN